MSIKVVLSDDHKIVREGLRALLEKESDIEVVGEARDGRAAINMVDDLSPHVVVMDVLMPDLNGVEATRQIINKYPNIKVIGLSMYTDKRFILSMLKAGALGYLLKDCASEELVQAIRSVSVGKHYISTTISNIIIEDYVHKVQLEDSHLLNVLTPREQEVLQLLAEGNTTREIASLLSVSMKTVETHRMQIMKKLNMHSVAELTKYAIREGLTPL